MVHIDCSALDNCKNVMESYGEICVHCNKCGRFDKKELKIESEKMYIEDKKINLCSTCEFCFADCKANFDDDSSKFGTGVGNDNVYKCKIYKLRNKEEM